MIAEENKIEISRDTEILCKYSNALEMEDSQFWTLVSYVKHAYWTKIYGEDPDVGELIVEDFFDMQQLVSIRSVKCFGLISYDSLKCFWKVI